ncbi:TrmH family RNA methyltransferase [Salisediminibacterium halotolerans]|uniref:RNA methyltransferase, TrmH family n=1 Tax=Salisediminibacterium halotolerans TaxID=517425 RepID=A0A1H9U1A5_9BACI|nr:RNA methyltransferase [Salisediminibacterium haloalkalitolerans]SES03082.1 RNA methyltransferase, TrmH family [Salisediminibacterium haloalkalitolerans]
MERIESVQNAKIKSWKKLHTKRGRDKSGLFLIEGRHLVEEGLKSNAVVKELVIRDDEEIPPEWSAAGVPVVYVTPKVMQELSETETPQGFAAVCEQPKAVNVTFEQGRFLLIDGIQDPGNLGTMIRTADAAGLTAVILGEGTADPYNGKVIRSTQGSLFHIPLQTMNLFDAIERCKDERIPVFGSSIDGSTYSVIAPQDNFALLAGNEAKGIQKELLNKTDQNLYIPIYGAAESLNVAVAAGILLYHLRNA